VTVGKLKELLKTDKSSVIVLVKDNEEMKKKIEAAEATAMKEKEALRKEREEAEDIIAQNIELRGRLETAEVARATAKEVRKIAEGLASASATRVTQMAFDLGKCMAVAKEVLDSMLVKARAAESMALPEADTNAFAEWLRAAVGLMGPVVDNVSYFDAFGGALGMVR
jgi:hypothetical protein